jgi:hypothetical protein
MMTLPLLVVLVDIDLVAGNLFDRVVVICDRVVGIELVVVGVNNARNVLRGKVVLDSGFSCGHSNRKRVGLLAAVAVEWR